MTSKLQIFTAESCAPCADIKEAIDSGKLSIEGLSRTEVKNTDIEVIDVTTEEGYPLIDEMGIDQIPVAYYEGRKCRILVDDETHAITLDCSENLDEADNEDSGAPIDQVSLDAPDS